MANDFRIERDTMGEMRVPADALYGAQTARAVENFPISGRRFPRAFIRALALIKSAAAQGQRAAGDRARGGRGGRGPARRSVRGRHLPDRQRHLHQHERQRGDRAPGRRASRTTT